MRQYLLKPMVMLALAIPVCFGAEEHKGDDKVRKVPPLRLFTPASGYEEIRNFEDLRTQLSSYIAGLGPLVVKLIEEQNAFMKANGGKEGDESVVLSKPSGNAGVLGLELKVTIRGCNTSELDKFLKELEVDCGLLEPSKGLEAFSLATVPIATAVGGIVAQVSKDDRKECLEKTDCDSITGIEKALSVFHPSLLAEALGIIKADMEEILQKSRPQKVVVEERAGSANGDGEVLNKEGYKFLTFSEGRKKWEVNYPSEGRKKWEVNYPVSTISRPGDPIDGFVINFYPRGRGSKDGCETERRNVIIHEKNAFGPQKIEISLAAGNPGVVSEYDIFEVQRAWRALDDHLKLLSDYGSWTKGA